MTRRVQDLEGEAKRARTETTDVRQKLGQHILDAKAREDHITKLGDQLKTLAAHLAEVENDLHVSETTCDEYEKIIQDLQSEVEGLKTQQLTPTASE